MKITLGNITLKKQSFERINSLDADEISLTANVGVKTSIEQNISEIEFGLVAEDLNKLEVFKMAMEYSIAFSSDISNQELKEMDQKEISRQIFEKTYKQEIKKQVKAILTNASLENIKLPAI